MRGGNGAGRDASEGSLVSHGIHILTATWYTAMPPAQHLAADFFSLSLDNGAGVVRRDRKFDVDFGSSDSRRHRLNPTR